MLIVYGKGVSAIAEDLHVDVEKAQEIKDSILKAFPDLKLYLDNVVEYCKETGYVKTFYGRKRRLPDIKLDEYTFEFFDVDEKTKQYYQGLYLGKLKKCKRLSEKQYIIQQAMSKGIRIHQNGGYISKAIRESYNAPVQGCMIGTTAILTKEYGMVCLQDVVDKYLTVWDGEKFVKAYCVYSGKKQLVRITFTDKRVIECSPNHKYLVMNTKGAKNFYSVDELSRKKTPQMIVTSNEVEDFNCLDKQDFPVISYSNVHNAHNYSFDVIEDMYELGYVLGWLHSDGTICKNKNCTWIFAENKYEIMPFIKSVLEKYFSICETVKTAKVRNRNQDIKYITVGSKTLANQALEMGIKHHIPVVIFKSKQAMKGFIQSCLDADGTVNKDNIVFTFGKGKFYEQFARELQLLLSNFGILSRLCFCNGAIHVNVVKKDVMNYYNVIGARNEVKKQRMLDIGYQKLSVYHKTIRIASIEYTNEFVDMYDIVNSDSHRFMANGVVTHNSAADITKRAMINIATNKRLKELGAEMILTIHDETCTSVPREHAYEASKIIEQCSIDAGEGLGAPLRCDIAISDRWEGQQYTFDENHNLIPLDGG